MKQTAVEWLLQQMDLETISKYDKQLVKALEMEWQQIIDAVNSQRQLGWDEKGEQYYNKTFKKP
jgi:hypothetical protein